MAKPLCERATSFRTNPRTPTTDLQNILPELREAIAQAEQRACTAKADSIDLALSVADRDEAAAEAERAGRLAQAYSEALADIEAKLTARRASEAHQRKDAERAAALAERDEIAKRFGAIVPEAVTALTGLFGEVLANAERMRRAGLTEADAEAAARGLPRTFAVGAVVVDRFTQMKIPAFGGKGRCWPPAKVVDTQRHVVAGRRQAQATRAAREAEWGLYRLSNRLGHGVSFAHRIDERGHEEQARSLHREPWEGQLRHTEAERLRELGVKVEPIDRATAEAETAAAEAKANEGVYFPDARRQFP